MKSSDNLIIISDYNRIDINQWHEFIQKHPKGNIFYTPEMVFLYDKVPGYLPIFFACKKNERIQGMLIGTIIFEPNKFLAFASSRCIFWGGPLVLNDSKDVATLLLREYSKNISRKCIYSEFRNLSDSSCFNEIFNHTGYSREDHLDIIVELSKGEEKLWQGLHSTRKKQILRGKKRGCITDISNKLDNNSLLKCYNILAKTYKNIGLPLPSFDFFHQVFGILGPKNSIKAFIAYFDREIIGFRFILLHKDWIYDWYAASDRNHKDKYPNDILPWEIFKWGFKNNYTRFDFGGAGHPREDYGVRNYKLKFGGELVNFGRYKRINKPLVYFLGKTAFKTNKYFKSKTMLSR